MIAQPLHRLPRLALAGVLLASYALLASPALPAQATVITVTTTSDDVTSNGNCTLREAIIAANTNSAVDACPAGSGADTITLPAGTFTLTIPGTSENLASTGDLDIYDDLTIIGASATTTIVDGGGIDRVLEIYDDAVVHITRLAVTGGNQTAAGAMIRLAGTAQLTLSVVRLYGAPSGVSYALYQLTGTTLTVQSSLIEDNLSGGLYTQAGSTTTIRNATISGNTATNGAGLSSAGTLVVVNSTFSGNSASFNGGGLFLGGASDLNNITVVNNTAGTSGTNGNGGGIDATSATVTLRNSILANNVDLIPSTVNDCSGALTSAGYNLIEDTAGCTITGDTTGNLTGIDPNVDVLDLNGGGIPTHRLLVGSPAINAGNPAGCLDEIGATLLTDQRLFLRNGVCDIGAYEFNSPGAATATPTLTSSPVPVTATYTATASRTPTNTALPPTATRTSTASPTASASATSTRTHTPGPSPTHTSTATAGPSNTAAPGLIRLYLTNLSKDDLPVVP